MTDKKPGPSLADLARADKAKRDDAAEQSDQYLRDHHARVRSTADRWAELNRDLLGAIDNINGQLAEGDISLSIKKGAVDPAKPHKLGDVTVTVTRKGAEANLQMLKVEGFRSGTGKLNTTVARPHVQTETFELQDVDPDWIARTLEAFVRRALA